MLFAQNAMTTAEQWNWVALAYGVAYVVLVVYAASVAIRITRARKRLEGET